jgi:hypothetical protein
MENNFRVAIGHYFKARLLFSEISFVVPKAFYGVA